MSTEDFSATLSEGLNAVKQSIESDCVFQSAISLIMTSITHNTVMTIHRLITEELLGYIVEKIQVNVEPLSELCYQRKVISRPNLVYHLRRDHPDQEHGPSYAGQAEQLRRIEIWPFQIFDFLPKFPQDEDQ